MKIINGKSERHQLLDWAFKMLKDGNKTKGLLLLEIHQRMVSKMVDYNFKFKWERRWGN